MNQDNPDLDFLLQTVKRQRQANPEQETGKQDLKINESPVVVGEREIPAGESSPDKPAQQPPEETCATSNELTELLQNQLGPESDFDDDFEDDEVKIISEIEGELLLLPLGTGDDDDFDLDAETELGKLLAHDAATQGKANLTVHLPEERAETKTASTTDSGDHEAEQETAPPPLKAETDEPNILAQDRPATPGIVDLRQLLDELEGVTGTAGLEAPPDAGSPASGDFPETPDTAAIQTPEAEETDEPPFRLNLSQGGKEFSNSEPLQQRIEPAGGTVRTRQETVAKPGNLGSPLSFPETKQEPERSTRISDTLKNRPQEPLPTTHERATGKPQKASANKWAGFSLAWLFEDTRQLGLDLGSSSIKYVQLQQRPRRMELINCGNFKLKSSDNKSEKKPGEGSGHGSILSKHLRPKHFKNTLFKTAISGMEIIFKNVPLPKRMSRQELQQAVPWACRKDLPFPLDATVFRFTRVSRKHKSDEGQHVFVVAAQRDLVNQHIRALGEAGVIPAKISTIPMALWQTFRACVRKNQDACHAVVDIGANSTHIVFIQNKQLQFAREITTASGDFTQALAGTLFIDGHEIVLSTERAEHIKQKYGIPVAPGSSEVVDGIPLIELSAVLGQVLDKLVTELHRTIDFYKEKFNGDGVKHIYLTGGGALIPNLARRLSHELEIEASILNPFETISLPKFENPAALKKAGPRFAVAVGLALDRGKEMNFLPANLVRTHIWQYLKRIVRYLSAIVLLAMVLMSQNVSRQFGSLQQKLVELQTEFRKTAPRRQRFQKLQQSLQQLDGELQPYRILEGNQARAAIYLKVLSNLLPPRMTLTSVRMTRGMPKSENLENAPLRETLTIDGIAFESDSMQGMNLARFLLALEKSGYFQTVILRSQDVSEDGHLQFTVDCGI